MEHQDWTTVVLKRRNTKRDSTSMNATGVEVEARDANRNERGRMSKIADMDYIDAPKKEVISESLQELIRKRMELKLSQDKADQLCNFPRHTMKWIESRRILPSSAHQNSIQKHFGVQLKITTK
jgi:DNA-binding XRE family transcriptional regulator